MRLLFLSTCLSLSLPAFSGSLINKDSTSYKYKIKCGGGTTSTSIGAKTTKSGSIKKGCLINLGSEKFTTTSDNDVLITKGKIEQK